MSEPRTDNPSSPSSAGALSTNYLRILREQWFVVALCFLLCVGGGLIGRNLVPTTYHAQADLQIAPIDIADNTYVGVNLFRSISSDPTLNVLTLARYLNTPETAAIAKQRTPSLGIAGRTADLDQRSAPLPDQHRLGRGVRVHPEARA